ncbi:MAG: CopG family antitoxin [Mariprofundaceae bacterium]|nr:CopG family antitoxin [Mariprofundaceae bacterium]
MSKAKRVHMPNLKSGTKSISIRLPVDLLEKIKVEANRRDVLYPSLIKAWLRESKRTRRMPKSGCRAVGNMFPEFTSILSKESGL